MRKILNITSLLLLFLIFSFGFVKEAKAATLRQEIPIITGQIAGSATGATAKQILDTTKYNGSVTYAFEAVGSYGTGGTMTLRLASDNSVVATLTWTSGETTYSRKRVSFSPAAGAATYYIYRGTTLTFVLLKTGRILVFQDTGTAALSSTETQIEIGNTESGKTNTSPAALTYPKYWTYTSANWDATQTYSAEVTYKTSTTNLATIKLQEDDGYWSWSDKVTIVNGVSNTTVTLAPRVSFTPTAGRHYRLSASTNSGSYDIHNAKIIVGQTSVMDSFTTSITTSANFGDSSANERKGQSFTTTSAYDATAISLYLGKIGSPGDNLYLELVSGSINGTVMATSSNIAGSTIVDSTAQIITFSIPATALSNATKYYIRAYRTGAVNASNYYLIYANTGGAYGGGGSYTYNGTWSSEVAGTDDGFLVYHASVTLLEPQYLLLNRDDTNSTGLQSFQQQWNAAEWDGVTNVYRYSHDATNPSDSSKLQDIDNGNADVTTGTQIPTGANQQIGTAFTMPTSGHQIDVNVTNTTGVVTAGRILVQVTILYGPTNVVFTNAARTLTAGACNGDANVLTIQLQDASSTPTNPTGTTVINVTSNSPSETVYSDNGCTSVTNDFTFTTAQNTKSVYISDNRKSAPTWTLTATKTSGPDTIADGTQGITINAGSVTRLVVTLPSQSFTDGVGNSGSVINQTAGSSFVITKISATDNYFNVNPGYSGAKTLGYAGPGNAPDTTPPSYTTSVSFTSGQSTTTLTTILYKAETPTITVTDGGLYGYASSSLTVDPGILNNYLVVAATPQTADVCFTGTNTVTARDQWNNTRTADGSVVNMTTSGTSVTFYTSAGCSGSTTQYTLSSGQATMYIKTPKKQSGFTVTATRNGFSETGTSGAITVDPGLASAILVKLPGQTFTDGTGISGSPSFTGLRTPNATAGTSYTVDFKAVDANNNLVNSGSNNYTGSKTISFADSVAGNAPNSQAPSFPGSPVTFANGEANALSVTYYNAAANRTVEADDTATPVAGIASTTFTVQAGSENNYGVSAGTPQTAGVAFNVTVTARDSWNNSLGSLYSAPAGTYIWTTTAGLAPDTTAPSIGTLIQGNFTNGVATKSVTLYKAESGVTFTASEPSPSTVTGTSSGVTVNPGNISADPGDSTVTGNASVSTDTNSLITITLKDTWRNPKSSVPAADIVLSATPTETVTQPSSPTDASGVTTGQIKWSNVGEKTVTVTIQTSTLVQNDGSTPDADGKLDDTHTITVVVSANVVEIKGGVEFRGGSLLSQ